MGWGDKAVLRWGSRKPAGQTGQRGSSRAFGGQPVSVATAGLSIWSVKAAVRQSTVSYGEAREHG